MLQEFQTRSQEGEIRNFGTFKEAYKFAKKHSGIWKISFSVGEERIRLVRNSDGKFEYESIFGDK